MIKLIKNKNLLRIVLFFLLIPIGYLNPILNWIVIIFGPFLVYNHPRKLLKIQDRYLLIMLFFLIIVLLTGIFSIDPLYPTKNALNILSLFVSSCFVSFGLKNKEDLLMFLNAVFLATFTYIIILYIVAFNGVTFDFVESETFGKNSSSLIILTGLISLIIRTLLTHEKIIVKFLCLFFFITIFLTGSIKVILASSILLSYFFFFKKGFKVKNIIVSAIVLFILFNIVHWYISFTGIGREQSFVRIISRISVLFGGESEIGYIDSEYMTGFRTYLINEGLDLFYQNPLFGIGLENTRHFLGTYTHNNFVEILAGTGIIGFSIYIISLLIIIKSIVNIPDINIKLVLLVSIFCFILVGNAQRIYDNRYLMVFLVSFLPISKFLRFEK